MKAVSIEKSFALFVAFDAALGAPETLSRHSPKEALTFIAVGWRSGIEDLEVVRCVARDGVGQGVECFPVDQQLLRNRQSVGFNNFAFNLQK